MEFVKRRITNTIIEVGKMISNDDGSVAIERVKSIEVRGRKVGKDAAARYVLKEYRSSDYVVIGVNHDEAMYSVPVEKFVEIANKEGE